MKNNLMIMALIALVVLPILLILALKFNFWTECRAFGHSFFYCLYGLWSGR